MKLDPADYWQLRALDADVNVARQQAAAVQQRRQAFWQTLAEKYKLVPDGNYRASDDDCSLTDASNGGPPDGRTN